MNAVPGKRMSLMDRFFGYETNEASKDFKGRWLMAIPAFATHMCIGSPWAWSLMADVLTREIGIVAPAAADWTLLESAFPLSMVRNNLHIASIFTIAERISVGLSTPRCHCGSRG